MYMVRPSGYCGAIKKINQKGRKNVAIRLKDAIAIIILELMLILFILGSLKTQVLQPVLPDLCGISFDDSYLAGGSNTPSIT
jgi:hypothetical protein